MKLHSAILSGLFSLPYGVMAAEPAIRSVEFTPTPAPTLESEMVVSGTRSAAIITYSDGSRRQFPLSYETLILSGEHQAGMAVDRHGRPILATHPDDKGIAAKGPFYSSSPDANSVLATRGDPVLITHFEYQTEAPSLDPAKPPLNMYARLPMSMTATHLRQDTVSGRLGVRRTANVDMAAIEGLWIPCAGTLTPWNTHLGGEEYEPDARSFQSRPLESMNLFLGTPGKTAAQGGAKPYRYGHLVEVAMRNGKAVPTRHYATGRLSFELADIQEDGRTAYFGDDGRDVGLFMFVADRVGDLSSGTLYAAKWQQLDASNGGSARLDWIRLGHATDAEIKALVDAGISFSDIFETSDAPADGFRSVYVYPGTGSKPRLEHLRPRTGMESAAAFLETRRFAAWRGATTEFTKMEGQTHDSAGRRLFTAMSYVEGGMLDGKNGEHPQDHIRLTGDAADLACGIVYQSTLRAGRYDTEGRAIASDWVASDMSALVLGSRRLEGTGGRYDKCDTDKVANADNLKFSPVLRTLFIGEDSGNHLNNYLWAYNIDTAALTRLAWAPIGAEWTGLAVVEQLGRHAYILSNIQHPGSATDLAKYPPEIRDEMRKRVDPRGAVGYFRGLPALR